MDRSSAPASITRRVSEGHGRDVGRGIVRLDPADLVELGVAIGAFVRVSGARETVCKAMPAFKEHRGRGHAQLDGVVRENAKAGIGDDVTLPPVDPPPAPEIEAGGEGEPASEPAPAPAPEAATLPRPDWWFEGVRRDEERVALCAEAAGPTVRDARRAAIAAARREIDRALDGALEREVVSMAMVLPLPAADAGPGAARYIGYVMMEARLR